MLSILQAASSSSRSTCKGSQPNYDNMKTGKKELLRKQPDGNNRFIRRTDGKWTWALMDYELPERINPHMAGEAT